MARRNPTPNEQHLVDAGLDTREAKSVAIDERGAAPTPAPAPHVASTWVHTTHPETGVDVVFVPGETLPEWAAPPRPAQQSNPEPIDYNGKKLEDLQALAEARGITHSTATLKGDLVAALEAADGSSA